jgi:hypothetical protein
MERLLGVGPATARVGEGARRFEAISEPQVGAPVIVNWGRYSATPSQTEVADPCTVTSRVVSIEQEVGV